MKNQIKILYYLFCLVLFSTTLSCQKDNYEAPSSSFKGNVIDKQSGRVIPQQTINGGILRLFQTDITANATAITSYFKADGSFENNMLFDGNYKVVADGPFFYEDTLKVRINKSLIQDISVRPYLYVTTELVSKTASSITVKVKTSLGEGNTNQKISRVGVTAGLTNSVDINFYKARELTNTESESNAAIVGTEYIYELKNLASKSTYYIRGAARTINTGNYYNYAPMLTIMTD
ncbi:DUF3823 domain-containing protein [Sphingobacterium detergens]|uniref:DUF3823 domain-containing protein n=1 Tax=Sphingobacterium detergens TaxID=1145106 RepID=UPI003AAD86A7